MTRTDGALMSRSWKASGPVEFFYGVGRVADLTFGQLLMVRQGQDAIGLVLRPGKIAALVSKPLSCRMQVKWRAIVKQRLDSASGEKLLQFVAPLRLRDHHHVRVLLVLLVRRDVHFLRLDLLAVKIDVSLAAAYA